jgi:hypothetical protein
LKQLIPFPLTNFNPNDDVIDTKLIIEQGKNVLKD